MIPIESIEKALNVKIATSQEMQEKQALWRKVFIGKADWNTSKVKSLMTAKSICKKIAKLVTLNLESEVSGSITAEFLNKQYQRFTAISGKNGFRSTVEKGCAGGTLVLRVFLRNFVQTPTGLNEGNLFVEVFENDMFYPIAFDEQGNIIDCVFKYVKEYDNKYYTLLEQLIYSPKNKTQQYIYKAYKSNDVSILGNEILLSTIEDWADLENINGQIFQNVERPSFATFVMPELGTDDARSPMGSAIFANAIDGIMKADTQEELTDHEFKAGRLKQQATIDLFKKDRNGNPIMDADMFTVFHDTLGEGKGFIDTYNPTFRDASLRSRLNDIKRDIEFAIGLSYGTISDINEQAKTATEIIHGREDTGSTVKEIQDSWQGTLMTVVDIMYDMGLQWGLCAPVELDKRAVSFWWSDSVVVTQEERQAAYNAELARLINALAVGLIKREVVTAFMYENSDYLSKITDAQIEEARERMGGVEDE